LRAPGWVDRDDREPASFSAEIVLSDGRHVPVTITNVSRQGCQIACDEILPIKARVELKLENESWPVEVRWALGGQAGLLFV
jgi:hypothetical protein